MLPVIGHPGVVILYLEVRILNDSFKRQRSLIVRVNFCRVKQSRLHTGWNEAVCEERVIPCVWWTVLVKILSGAVISKAGREKKDGATLRSRTVLLFPIGLCEARNTGLTSGCAWWHNPPLYSDAQVFRPHHNYGAETRNTSQAQRPT
jgi:hypothetical protein